MDGAESFQREKHPNIFRGVSNLGTVPTGNLNGGPIIGATMSYEAAGRPGAEFAPPTLLVRASWHPGCCYCY